MVSRSSASSPRVPFKYFKKPTRIFTVVRQTLVFPSDAMRMQRCLQGASKRFRRPLNICFLSNRVARELRGGLCIFRKKNKRTKKTPVHPADFSPMAALATVVVSIKLVLRAQEYISYLERAIARRYLQEQWGVIIGPIVIIQHIYIISSILRAYGNSRSLIIPSDGVIHTVVYKSIKCIECRVVSSGPPI